jgi:hypothetical protein
MIAAASKRFGAEHAAAPALAGVRRGEKTVVPAVIAAGGLAAELWALRASARTRGSAGN